MSPPPCLARSKKCRQIGLHPHTNSLRRSSAAARPKPRPKCARSRRYGLDRLDAQPIPGTTAAYQPLFSPDGEWLAFEAGGKLRKVRLDGSAPMTIANASSANGADWTTTDQIVLGSEANRTGLSRVNAAGGEL